MRLNGFQTSGGSPEPDYWLRRCEGFAVYSPPDRYLGLVEEIRYRSRIDRPDTLVVRAGTLGRKRLVVSVDEVEEILPSKGRLVLRTVPLGARSRGTGDHHLLSLRRARRAASPGGTPEAA